MLKCIAIDDEPLALRQLTSYISKIPYLDLGAKYNNALEAQQMLAGEKVDLIFVDINMPDLNGVDFVRALIDRPMTPRLAMDLYSSTAEALARWEPRFKLTRVRIASATVGQVVLDLEGIYLPDGKATLLNGLEV